MIVSRRFILALLGLAGDPGFLQSLENASGQQLPRLNSQILPDRLLLRQLSSKILPDVVGQTPVAAPAARWLAMRADGDRRRKHATAGHVLRRLAAAHHPSVPPTVRLGSALPFAALVGHPSTARPAVAAAHSRRHSRSGRPVRPASVHRPAAQPAAASGRIPLTLLAVGPALGGAGGIASGAVAVVLAAALLLRILQLLSGRLSLELAPWRSAFLMFRLERPG